MDVDVDIHLHESHHCSHHHHHCDPPTHSHSYQDTAYYPSYIQHRAINSSPSPKAIVEDEEPLAQPPRQRGPFPRSGFLPASQPPQHSSSTKEPYQQSHSTTEHQTALSSINTLLHALEHTLERTTPTSPKSLHSSTTHRPCSHQPPSHTLIDTSIFDLPAAKAPAQPVPEPSVRCYGNKQFCSMECIRRNGRLCLGGSLPRDSLAVQNELYTFAKNNTAIPPQYITMPPSSSDQDPPPPYAKHVSKLRPVPYTIISHTASTMKGPVTNILTPDTKSAWITSHGGQHELVLKLQYPALLGHVDIGNKAATAVDVSIAYQRPRDLKRDTSNAGEGRIGNARAGTGAGADYERYGGDRGMSGGDEDSTPTRDGYGAHAYTHAHAHAHDHPHSWDHPSSNQHQQHHSPSSSSASPPPCTGEAWVLRASDHRMPLNKAKLYPIGYLPTNYVRLRFSSAKPAAINFIRLIGIPCEGAEVTLGRPDAKLLVDAPLRLLDAPQPVLRADTRGRQHAFPVDGPPKESTLGVGGVYGLHEDGFACIHQL